MGKFDSLKLDEAIAPVAPLAQRHNWLVDLVEGMVGQNGVKVTVSEGRILFELDRTTAGDALNGTNGSGSGGSGTATELHYSNGSRTVDIDGNALTATYGSFYFNIDASTGVATFKNNTTSQAITIDPYTGTSTVHIAWPSTGGDIVFAGSSGAIVLTGTGGKTATINPTSLAQNVSFQNLAVNNSGSPANVLALISAPF